MTPHKLGSSTATMALYKWCKTGFKQKPEDMIDVLISNMPASFILEPEELQEIKQRLARKTVSEIKTQWMRKSREPMIKE